MIAKDIFMSPGVGTTTMVCVLAISAVSCGDPAAIADCASDPNCDLFGPGSPLVGAGPDDGERRYVQVSAGDDFTCAVDDGGEIVCFGRDDWNVVSGSPSRRGDWSGTSARRFQEVSANGASACALDTEGEIFCWGINHDLMSYPPAGPHRAISASSTFSCVIDDDGALACWGYGPDNIFSDIPEGRFHTLAVSANNGCVIDDDDVLHCWGALLGSGRPEGRVLDVAAESLGDFCAVLVGGALACWGEENELRNHPPPDGLFTHVGVAGDSACALDQDGVAHCWGPEYSETLVPPADAFVDLSVAYSHACGLTADGEIVCWGRNDEGQLDVP